MEYKVSRHTAELIKASGLFIEISQSITKVVAQSLLEQIQEAQERGELTREQAMDSRGAVYRACQVESGHIAQNEAIEELDRKVAEAVRFYRLCIAQHPKGEGASNLSADSFQDHAPSPEDASSENPQRKKYSVVHF